MNLPPVLGKLRITPLSCARLAGLCSQRPPYPSRPAQPQPVFQLQGLANLFSWANLPRFPATPIPVQHDHDYRLNNSASNLRNLDTGRPPTPLPAARK